MDHLFFHYEIASALWSNILSRVGLTWVMLACRRGLSGSPQSATTWKMVLSCLLWCIWREKKNDKSFEDRERKMVDLKSFFFNTLYHWVVALNFPNLLGFHDFLDCFYFSN